MEEIRQEIPTLSNLQSRIKTLKTHRLLDTETEELIETCLREIGALTDDTIKGLFQNKIASCIKDSENKLEELKQRENLVATCLTQISANSHILNALQHFQLGNYRRAISTAQKSINAGQETNLAYKIMAMCYFKKNDSERENISRQNYSEANRITEEQFLGFQEDVSKKLLHNKTKNDLDQALKYFRRKKYVKAISAANDCIDKGIDIHFAHLLIALSLYQLKPKDQENLKEILTHLHHAKNFPASKAELSTREIFAKEWAECLFNSFNIQISDVAQLIAKGLRNEDDARTKLSGLVEFGEANPHFKLNTQLLGAYTSYQILKELRAQKVITTGEEYITQLKDLGVTKSDDADLHKKIKRQIDQHDPLHPVKRAAAYGAQSARRFFKAAGEKQYVNAMLRLADDFRRSKISGPIDVIFHLLPHTISLAFSAIAYAATAVFAGIRWLLSPFIGKAIIKAEEKAEPKAAIELPVKIFKYEHVKKGPGLAFFAVVTPPRSEQLMNVEPQQRVENVR
ncbi:MAG: hypothetical protein SFW07_05620 [Gammaproteobacteria bacterium]|nr:hypothetical protein [Gammaproteobacteria bacterium]